MKWPHALVKLHFPHLAICGTYEHKSPAGSDQVSSSLESCFQSSTVRCLWKAPKQRLSAIVLDLDHSVFSHSFQKHSHLGLHPSLKLMEQIVQAKELILCIACLGLFKTIVKFPLLNATLFTAPDHAKLGCLWSPQLNLGLEIRNSAGTQPYFISLLSLYIYLCTERHQIREWKGSLAFPQGRIKDQYESIWQEGCDDR